MTLVRQWNTRYIYSAVDSHLLSTMQHGWLTIHLFTWKLMQVISDWTHFLVCGGTCHWHTGNPGEGSLVCPIKFRFVNIVRLFNGIFKLYVSQDVRVFDLLLFMSVWCQEQETPRFCDQILAPDLVRIEKYLSLSIEIQLYQSILQVDNIIKAFSNACNPDPTFPLLKYFYVYSNKKESHSMAKRPSPSSFQKYNVNMSCHIFGTLSTFWLLTIWRFPLNNWPFWIM